MFIVFEGPDHAGKSTLVEKLYEYLEKEKVKVWKTREPGGTPIGEAIREILKDPKYSDITPICEEMLFAGIRNQHCEVIKDKLLNGYTILCDRFVQSSYVYQGFMNGNNSIVYAINHVATRGLKPDLIILITCDPEEAMKRGEANDRIELSKSFDDIKNIHSAYKEICETGLKEGEDWKVLDTTGKSVEESFNELIEIITPYQINFLRE